VIVTVTPNVALDITYEVERLVPHASHRVAAVRAMAGGKGINVASVLTGQGNLATAVGVVGGVTGELVRTDLAARGIPHVLVEADHETRRTVTVVSLADGEATAFNEPGPAIGPPEWSALLSTVRRLASEPDREAGVLVGSGSVPEGFPEDGYAQLVRAAADAGWRTVVDSSGPALLAALAGAPDVVKPNARELAEVTGLEDPVSGAKALQDKGARDVLVSLGPEGLVLVSGDGDVVRAALESGLAGNATGAGDAVVAAVARSLAEGGSPEVLLTDAVAWSAAAVLQPVAGVVDEADVARLRGSVRVWRD
jgi:1-phosphofructokinase family hexose kinase